MKRKVLISVLAVALVLTLCICMFVACDPKPKKSAPKVTVYGTDGKELGTEQSVDMGDGTYSMTDPAQEYTLKAAQYTYFTYQLYDPATKEKKGAFDYRSFTQDSDFSVIVVAEGIGTTKATTLEDKWLGYYSYEHKTGEVSTVEINKGEGEGSDNIMLTLQTGQLEPIKVTGLAKLGGVWTKDGSYIIEYDYEMTPEGDTTEEPETYYTYYAFALSADGKTLTMTNLSDMADGPYTFTKMPQISVKVHYNFEGQDKTATMIAMNDGNKYTLNNPVETLENGALPEALQVGETYNLYYYDAAATGHKGAAFNKSGFTAEADFDIIVVKESVGTKATKIDASWNGDFAGKGRWTSYTLEIDATKGTIYVNDDYEIDNTWTVGTDNVYTTADGKLVLAGAEPSYMGGGWNHSYYYLTKNADGTITFESDSETVTLGKVTFINLNVYFSLGGQIKSETVKISGIAGKYKLDMAPEDYLEDNYDAFMATLKYGQKFTYFHYTNNTKGEAFDLNEEFEESNDISILIEIETFATVATSIDAKYSGTFTGTDSRGSFTVTIDATKGTIELKYPGSEDSWMLPDPVEASIENGTILIKDGKLVFVEEAWNKKVASAHYYYLTEQDGKFTLEYDYWNEPVELTKANA